MNLLEKLDQESDVVEELRHHLELVLEGFVGGSLESAPIGKIFRDPTYNQLISEFRPRLNEAFVSFLSALLYALKTSLIDIGLIDHRAYDLSAAHETLKNVVNSLKSSTQTWLSKLPEEPKMREFANDTNGTGGVDDIESAKGSLTYERALAMSCINKVVISSLKKSSNATIPEQKLGGDYSYESTTSLTVYCDGGGDCDDQNWKASENVEFSDVKSDLLKKFCAASAGGVPFPEYGVDIVDSAWDRTSSTAVNEAATAESSKTSSVAMTSTDWEDNWLFRKKPLNRSGAFNLEPVEMVIPKPNRPEGVTLGSLEIDALSELSENNSVASLDFSSSESESDRPQVTGAVMKPQVKSTENSGLSKVTISDQKIGRLSGTTVVTVNGVSDRVLIEQQKQQSQQRPGSVIPQADVTVITGGPLLQKTVPAATKKTLDEKPLVGLRAKASFDGKVVMENIDDVKERSGSGNGSGICYKSKDSVESSDRRTPLGRSATSYDELSVRAFKEETLHSLEQRFEEFEEHVADNTGTTSSLKSLSEEDLDIHTSVSTEFSFRRSPEGCSKSNTPNITSMFIGKSSSSPVSISPGADNKSQQVEDIVRTLTKSALEKSQTIEAMTGTRMMSNKETSTANEEMVSVSISSGRGSTASTTSASSVQSYELSNQRETVSRLSEASIDRDRSISAEPAQDPAVICNPLTLRAASVSTTTAVSATTGLDERPSSSTEQSHERRPDVNVTASHKLQAAAELEEAVEITTERTATVGSPGATAAAKSATAASSSSTTSTTTANASATESAPEEKATGRHEGNLRTPELDRDQDIYCVLPASKLEVQKRKSTMQQLHDQQLEREIEQRIQRFQSNTLPNPKRRHFTRGARGEDGSDIEEPISSSIHPIPAKRNLLKLNSSQREVNIYPSSSPVIVDTIPVPKNRRSFTQVFPHRALALAPEQTVLAEAEEPKAIPLRTRSGASFGVQIYPAPAPQPRPRRSPGGVDAMCTSRRTPSPCGLAGSNNSSQEIGITSMKKAVIEKDLRDKLPNVRRLASRFREPVRPGDYQSATLPAPSRRRRELGRKDAVELNNRLSHFDSFS